MVSSLMLICVLLLVVAEVDQDGHVYYNEEQHQIRQKLIENLDFTFIRINPDAENFDLDVEIAKICNYINESPVRLAVKLVEKYLKERFAKELLSFMSSFSKFFKSVRYFVKNNNMEKKTENTYCLVCRKKADNKKIRAVALVNKIATQRSLCTVCTSSKSTF